MIFTKKQIFTKITATRSKSGITPKFVKFTHILCISPNFTTFCEFHDFLEFHGFRDSDEDSDDFLWISRDFWILSFSDILVVPGADLHDFDDFDRKTFFYFWIVLRLFSIFCRTIENKHF